MCKGALSRGSAGYEAVEKLPTVVLLHRFGFLQFLDIRPWNLHECFIFLPGHYEVFFLIYFKILEKRSWIGAVPTSYVCLQFSVFTEPVDFWQFVEPLLLRMEQNRQGDLACDEEPWCLPGSDSSDGRWELDGESEVSDFPQLLERRR